MHIEEGTLRAYLDEELPSEEFENTKNHLVSCPQCQEAAEALKNETGRVLQILECIDDGSKGPPEDSKAALAQMKTQIDKSKEKEVNMSGKLFSSIPRPAWIILAVIALLAIGLTFSPIRAIANTFLGLFRVEQVRVVEFQNNDMSEKLGASSQFEYMMSNQVNIQEYGDPQDAADAAEASSLAGFAVRLPSETKQESSIRVIPGGKATFNIDLEQINTILTDIDRSDIQLPRNLDGASITVEIPASIEARFGECEFEEMESELETDSEAVHPSSCISFIQAPSPVVEAPPDLDLVKIGEAFLQITGMSPEEAADFSQNVDWATTLIIPVPRYYSEHEEVPVDGVTGILIKHYEYKTGDMYLLVWVKDGIIHGLTGPGEKSDALLIANSLK